MIPVDVRSMALKRKDYIVFITCYTSVSSYSWRNIASDYVPEMRRRFPSASIIICSLKSDMIDGEPEKVVSIDLVDNYCRNANIDFHTLVSPKKLDNVDFSFDTLVVDTRSNVKRQNVCCLLF